MICVDPRKIIIAGFLAVASAMFAPLAHGQAVAVAEVDGIVSDTTGKVMVNVQVTMIQTETQAVRSTFTDVSGRYAIGNLPPGPYTMDVKAPGFKDYRQTGLVLQVGQTIAVNVAMTVGAVSETVEVAANASMVETKDTGIAQVIDENKVVDLPLNGRNLTQLLTLVGGGTTTPAGDLTGSKNIQGSQASGTFSVGGSQANGISYLLDGGDNNDSFSNVNLPIPIPDMVLEFSVQTNALQAQYGLHPGGVVNIVTKSGTNSWHGDFFEFLRNYELNARTKGLVEPSGSVAQPARDSLKRNQFGGTVGSKIVRDKLFFFAGYQQTVQRSNPGTNTAHVPTALTAVGNFSVEDAATSTGGCQSKPITLKDPLGGTFPNNQIPLSRFDPAAEKLLSSYIPQSTDNCGLFLYGQPANNPDYQYIGRVDYVRSDKHTLFGRYYLYNYTAEAFYNGSNALTTGPNPGNRDQTMTATFGDTYTLSPTSLNSFHATFDRRADNRGVAPGLFGPDTLGIQGFQENMPNTYMQITVSNYFNVACGTCAPGFFDVNNYQASDDYSKTWGKHQFSAGVDFRKEQFNSVNNQQSNGQWTFSGTATGDALADVVLGKTGSLTDGNALSDYIRQTVFGIYAQDSWRMNSHLTLNYGVRWEPYEPPSDKQCRGNQFNLSDFISGYHSTQYPNAPAGLLFGHDTANANGCGFENHHWLDMSPRLGLVWDPTGSGKQTVRAAFALMHDTNELFYPERWTTNPPYASSVALGQNTGPTGAAGIAGPFSNPWLGVPGGDPFPSVGTFPASSTFVTIPASVKAEYMMQWNISYSRQIAKDWLATATYVGNRTNHILGANDINMPQPSPTATTGNEPARRLLTLLNPVQGAFYSSVIQTDAGATSSYNALLAKVEHRFAQHYTLLTNFTWSHCVSTWDFGNELAADDYQNPNNRDAEKGDCNFDRRYIFNTSLVATSAGLGEGVLKGFTKDWRVAPIVSLYSGQPVNILDGTDVSLTGEAMDRPNVVAGVSNPFPHTTNEWFNPALFAGNCSLAAWAGNPSCQPAGTFGDAGRDVLHGPGTIQWDMAVSRIFPIKERWNLEIRADFFNIMNHANWNAPTAALNSSTFGQVTSFGTPREIQLAAKVHF
jgi:hypothetical protein